MEIRLVLACVVSLCAAVFAPPSALASPPQSGKPSITIISPQNNAVIHGSTLTVRVAVSNFKLVKPLLLPPPHWSTIPLLKGNQGHIHYLLDGNLLLSRDVVVKTSHTWKHVAPGLHTITAYLANSQHEIFPGTNLVQLHLAVPPPPKSGGSARLRVVTQLPKTGGGQGAGGSWLPLAAVVGCLLLITLGIGYRSVRTPC